MRIHFIFLLLVFGLNTTLGASMETIALPEASVVVSSKEARKQAKKAFKAYRRKAKEDGDFEFYLGLFALLVLKIAFFALDLQGFFSGVGGGLTYGQALLLTLGGIAFLVLIIAIILWVSPETEKESKA